MASPEDHGNAVHCISSNEYIEFQKKIEKYEEGVRIRGAKLYSFDISSRKRKFVDIESLQWNRGITKSFRCQYNSDQDVFEFSRTKTHQLLLDGAVLDTQIKSYIEDVFAYGSNQLKKSYRRLKQGKMLLNT